MTVAPLADARYFVDSFTPELAAFIGILCPKRLRLAVHLCGLGIAGSSLSRELQPERLGPAPLQQRYEQGAVQGARPAWQWCVAVPLWLPEYCASIEASMAPTSKINQDTLPVMNCTRVGLNLVEQTYRLLLLPGPELKRVKSLQIPLLRG